MADAWILRTPSLINATVVSFSAFAKIDAAMSRIELLTKRQANEFVECCIFPTCNCDAKLVL